MEDGEMCYTQPLRPVVARLPFIYELVIRFYASTLLFCQPIPITHIISPQSIEYSSFFNYHTVKPKL